MKKTYERGPLTADEQRLIDEAVAAGRVRKFAISSTSDQPIALKEKQRRGKKRLAKTTTTLLFSLITFSPAFANMAKEINDLASCGLIYNAIHTSPLFTDLVRAEAESFLIDIKKITADKNLSLAVYYASDKIAYYLSEHPEAVEALIPTCKRLVTNADTQSSIR